MGLFDTQVSRHPNLYPWTDEYIFAMQDGFWTDRLFNFQSDIQDFKINLTTEERDVVTRSLSTIAQVEIDIKTFWGRLGDNLPHPYLRDLGYVMASTEVVHNYAYERLLKVLNLKHLVDDNLKLDVLKDRVNYLKKHNHKYYENSKKQYIYALILFTLFMENVSLFSQFYILLWFGRYKNVLKDVNQQVSYTKNEELVHAQVGMKIINVLREEYPELFDKELQLKIENAARNAFKCESEIVDWILGGYEGPRLNKEVLKEYVKYKINDSLVSIGYNPVFDINLDLARDYEWMDEEVLGHNKTDFFFKRPVDYAKKNRAFTEEELF